LILFAFAGIWQLGETLACTEVDPGFRTIG